MELVLWNPGLPETRSTFSCVCKIVSNYVFFSFLFFLYKKENIYNQHKTYRLQMKHEHREGETERDNTVRSQSSESSTTNLHSLRCCTVLKIGSICPFFFFSSFSNIPTVRFLWVADLFIFLNSRKKLSVCKPSVALQEKTNDNMSELNISDNRTKANKPKR